MDRPRDDVPLAQAAFELRVGYLVARDLVLRGALRGHQTDAGRWLVSREDLDRMRRERADLATA